MRAFLRSNEWSCVYTTHSEFLVFRTAATVHPPYWQNGGLYPPDLTVTDRLLVPANAKAGSAARSPQTSRFLAEGIIGHARLLLPQPSLAVCVRRRCPNRGVATGIYFPMRHRTNHHNWTIETDASTYCCYIVKVFALQRFQDSHILGLKNLETDYEF